MKQSEFKRRYDVKMGDMLKRIFMEKLLPMFPKRLVESLLERRQKKLLKQQPKKPFRLLLLRLVNTLSKKQGIKLFSY